MLARIARMDPQLLHPIHHRSLDAQCDLAVIKGRDMLVKTRSILIGHVRGTVKSVGRRVSSCGADTFHRRLAEQMPPELEPALEPLMKSIEELTARIHHCDKKVEERAQKKYSQTEGLREIGGVGPVTSLAFVLTIEDPSRFKASREVGPFLGMTPKRDQSGQTDKQLPVLMHHLWRTGDTYDANYQQRKSERQSA